MVRIATDEAQAHLAELVQRASRGETILITEGGHPMAKLIPADESIQHRLSHEQVLVNLQDIRSRSKPGSGETLEDLLRKGMKH